MQSALAKRVDQTLQVDRLAGITSWRDQHGAVFGDMKIVFTPTCDVVQIGRVIDRPGGGFRNAHDEISPGRSGGTAAPYEGCSMRWLLGVVERKEVVRVFCRRLTLRGCDFL